MGMALRDIWFFYPPQSGAFGQFWRLGIAARHACTGLEYSTKLPTLALHRTNPSAPDA